MSQKTESLKERETEDEKFSSLTFSSKSCTGFNHLIVFLHMICKQNLSVLQYRDNVESGGILSNSLQHADPTTGGNLTSLENERLVVDGGKKFAPINNCVLFPPSQEHREVSSCHQGEKRQINWGFKFGSGGSEMELKSKLNGGNYPGNDRRPPPTHSTVLWISSQMKL